MFIHALSLAANRAVGVGCRGVSANQFRMTLPSTAAAVSTSNMLHNMQRSISTSSPLQSSPDTDEGDETVIAKAEKPISDEKKAIIQRWMKMNTSKTWRYTPNKDLIAKIGKEGTTSPLDAFRDLVPTEKRVEETVGRSWSVKELRRKSYDDLHKLWYVLYKEVNMLLTESNLARRHSYEMIQPDRRRKAKKSMGAIKHVLGERKRKKIADWKAYKVELERFDGLMAEMNLESDPIEEAMDTEAENMSSNEKA
mmetsp:Transcript_20538/g.44576  ORF Transcript_20538/g.44576 Transcript_20538/m.44576 type:complete len:253 (+) Transcript_20538:137-895(+)